MMSLIVEVPSLTTAKPRSIILSILENRSNLDYCCFFNYKLTLAPCFWARDLVTWRELQTLEEKCINLVHVQQVPIFYSKLKGKYPSFQRQKTFAQMMSPARAPAAANTDMRTWLVFTGESIISALFSHQWKLVAAIISSKLKISLSQNLKWQVRKMYFCSCIVSVSVGENRYKQGSEQNV